MMRTTILMGALFLAQATFAEEKLTQLLAKIGDAYGGREHLEMVVAFRESGQVEAATSIGRSGPMSRVFARPQRLRVEIGDGAASKEVRVLDGTNGWRQGKPATGTSLQAMILQAVRLDLPWQLLSHPEKVIEKPGIERGGKHLRVLELPIDSNSSVEAGIEAESGRIIYSRGTISNGPTGPVTFETDYDDFRTVDGLLFAFKETNSASGTKTADIVLSVITLLKSAPDTEFKP